MDFRPLSEKERTKLMNALRGNAENGDAILMNRRDTTFLPQDEVTDEDVVASIKSVPTHY